MHLRPASDPRLAEAAVTRLLQPDAVLLEDFGERSPHTGPVFIRALVDEEYVVVVRCDPKTGRWAYAVEERAWFEALYQAGCLRPMRTGPPPDND